MPNRRNKMNMQTTTIDCPVVIPESIEECYEMLEHDNLVGLEDFAHEAGFQETVVVTQNALKRMVGERSYYQPKLFIPAIVQSLRDMRAILQQIPGQQTPVLLETDIDGEVVDVLVRQNPLAHPPFTLVTLQ